MLTPSHSSSRLILHCVGILLEDRLFVILLQAAPSLLLPFPFTGHLGFFGPHLAHLARPNVTFILASLEEHVTEVVWAMQE